MIKIERTYPAPKSLAEEAKKASGQYNLPDVTEQLRKDFFDKCYICEIKPVSDPQVEHRLPHKNNTIPGRKFDWDNLFWACTHCNNVKNKGKYDAGIIDCCKIDPEDVIFVSVNEKTVYAEALDKSNPEANLTAELIKETFNQTNTGIRIAACKVRMEQAQSEMNKLYAALESYNKDPDSAFNKKALRALLNRGAAFAAFKRNYVRTHIAEYPALREYLQ